MTSRHNHFKEGYSLIEVIVSMVLMLGIISCVEQYLHFARQQQILQNDIRLAHQLLINIDDEMSLSNDNWNNTQLNEWQQYIKHYLPTAKLNITHNFIGSTIEIQWPANTTLAINCQHSQANQVCIGI